MTRLNNFFLHTYKENPSDAEVISHKLMLRSGMIQSHASGIYSLLPLGYKVCKKVSAIVIKHMDAANACELEMPVVQPAILWQQSNRWYKYGADLAKFKDRHDIDFCLGPTHEEIAVDIAKSHIKSYKHLPFSIYQIQTKFRDEIRPRFGVMRGREFTMKDAYSFHVDTQDLNREYLVMKQTYANILDEMQLNWVSVSADSGAIGGEVSCEFQILSQTGEDWVVISSDGQASNLEIAMSKPDSQIPKPKNLTAKMPLQTPDCKTISDLAKFAQDNSDMDMQRVVKSLLKVDENNNYHLLVLRGEDQLNEVLFDNYIGKKSRNATDVELLQILNCPAGSIGPIGIPAEVNILIDPWAKAINGFICGANQAGLHLLNCDWTTDVGTHQVIDLRKVKHGDPDNKGGNYTLTKGIEVGHIFQLSDHYTKPMKFTVSSATAEDITPLMGCYGFGITRVIAAAIEQNHDDKGIIWPMSIAPWHIHLIQIGNDSAVSDYCNTLYNHLSLHYDVALDDRDIRPGVKFADADLIGCPMKIIIGSKALNEDALAIEIRKSSERVTISSITNIDQVVIQIENILKSLT